MMLWRTGAHFALLTSYFSHLTSHFSLLTFFFPDLLRVPRRQRYPAGALTVETDLERVLARAGQRNIEHQHRAGLHVDHTRRGLTELNGSLAPQQLGAGFVHKLNPDGVHAYLGPPPPNPE